MVLGKAKPITNYSYMPSSEDRKTLPKKHIGSKWFRVQAAAAGSQFPNALSYVFDIYLTSFRSFLFVLLIYMLEFWCGKSAGRPPLKSWVREHTVEDTSFGASDLLLVCCVWSWARVPLVYIYIYIYVYIYIYIYIERERERESANFHSYDEPNRIFKARMYFK